MIQLGELLTKRYGQRVEGPTGLKMPESVARAIESASKTLPKDFTYRRVAKSVSEFTLDAGERTDVSVVTTDAVDRDEEVLLPNGIEWGQFKSNPIVTFAHNYDELPAGTCQWIKAKANGYIAKTLYPTKPEDWGDAPWLPSAVLHLMQHGTCKGKSLGFIPVSVRAATTAEKSVRPELKDVPIIDKCIALEYAIAPVPCNPEAGVLVVAKGADVDDHVLELVKKSIDELNIPKSKDLVNAVNEAMKEAVTDATEQVRYILFDDFKYALMRRVQFSDEHKQTIQQAMLDVFSRACGEV
jgi:hypothetical protein